jgi:hypothetical protein
MIADLGLAHCTAVGESGGKKKIHESAEGRHRWQSERPSAVFRSTQCQRQKKACTRKSKSDPDIARACRRWIREQGMLDPARLVRDRNQHQHGGAQRLYLS